jgi:heterotetrameric sarcosine oxidase gamma subunit
VVEPPVAMSPLAGLPAPSGRAPDIDLTERPFLVKLTLRGESADGGFTIAAARALGLAPPAQPGNGVHDGSLTILCLAPDEWLVVSEPGARDLVARLREALADRHAAAVDVSCATATITVSGSRAALLLRKICSIDLARQESRGRCCWQTRIGPFAVLIHRRAADQGFDLHVARSYARSFWLWLNDAAAEFGT